MKIEVLGPGCARCNMLAMNAKKAADKLGLDYELVKVSNLSEIAARGVMATPALVIDGKVKTFGKVPSEADLTALLQTAALEEGGQQ
jgi:small redox-active disulfide protein 2